MEERFDLWGDRAIRAFPEAFDNRQRPKCGVWGEAGPCICGDAANHRRDASDYRPAQTK